MFNRCVFLLGREDRWSEMQLSPSTISFLFVYLFAFLLFFFGFVLLLGTLRLVNNWLVVSVLRLTGVLWSVSADGCPVLSLLTFSVLLWCGCSYRSPDHTAFFFSLSETHAHNPQPTAGHKNGPYYQMDHFICLCFPWGVGAPFDRLLEWCSQTDRLSAPPLSVFNVCVMACAEMVTIPCLYTIRTLLTGNNHEPFFFCLVLNSHICSVFFFLQEGLRGLDSMICSLVCRLFGV